MNAVRVAEWFKSKKIKKFWYLIFYSLFFDLIMTVSTRFSAYLIDVYLYNEKSEAFRSFSITFSLILFAGLGFYLANTGWNEAEKLSQKN